MGKNVKFLWYELSHELFEVIKLIHLNNNVREIFVEVKGSGAKKLHIYSEHKENDVFIKEDDV